MAEVEEYLNSGDYEMSDKKYPYIGEGKRSGNIVLFTGKRTGVVIVEGESVVDKYQVGYKCNTWDEAQFKNITREYLVDTYGKCESQEHALFIFRLAKNQEIYVKGFNYKKASYFMIVDNELYFYSSDEMPKRNKCKLIHLPLPPYEKEMKETKPAPTIEDELLEFILESAGYSGEELALSSFGRNFIKNLTSKYNITPKG